MGTENHWPRCRSILRVVKFDPMPVVSWQSLVFTPVEHGLLVEIQPSNDFGLWHRLQVENCGFPGYGRRVNNAPKWWSEAVSRRQLHVSIQPEQSLVLERLSETA